MERIKRSEIGTLGYPVYPEILFDYREYGEDKMRIDIACHIEFEYEGDNYLTLLRMQDDKECPNGNLNIDYLEEIIKPMKEMAKKMIVNYVPMDDLGKGCSILQYKIIED